MTKELWSAGADRTGPSPNLTDPEDLKLEIALSVRSRATCQNVSAPEGPVHKRKGYEADRWRVIREPPGGARPSEGKP